MKASFLNEVSELARCQVSAERNLATAVKYDTTGVFCYTVRAYSEHTLTRYSEV